MERVGDEVHVSGGMRLMEAAQLLAKGEQHLAQGSRVFNLAAVEAADSSALAVMLSWQRSADRQGIAIRFTGAPANIRALAELYGLHDLLLAA